MGDESRDLLTREAFRLAELNLESENTLMIAADQRATTFCGILVAALAIIASQYNADVSQWNDDLSLIVIGFAAALAAFSARSQKIFSTGLSFKSFDEDFANETRFESVLADLGHHYDDCSAKNREVLARNAKVFNASLFASMIGFAIGLFPNIVTLFSTLSAIFTSCGGNP